MPNEQITIELSAAEALVLFEFVSKYTDKGILAIADHAEQRVLWNICARLESILVEPFLPDYVEQLKNSACRSTRQVMIHPSLMNSKGQSKTVKLKKAPNTACTRRVGVAAFSSRLLAGG